MEHHLGVLRRRRPAVAAHRPRRAHRVARSPGCSSTASSRRCSTARRPKGTAQELSAVELKKRMDTLDALATNVLQFFIVIIAGLMVLGRLGLDIGPAVAGLGVVGIAVGFGAQFLVRDYLNGALILIENQFGRGDVVRLAGRVGHGRGLHPAPDDAARPRRRRPHGPERRDQGRLQPDPGLVADQPGRDGRLRHRHRQGDRGRRQRRVARWPATRSGSGGSSRRRASSGSRRWAETGSRSRSSARSAPPTSGPPPATSASACSPRSRSTASRSRGRSASS